MSKLCRTQCNQEAYQAIGPAPPFVVELVVYLLCGGFVRQLRRGQARADDVVSASESAQNSFRNSLLR